MTARDVATRALLAATLVTAAVPVMAQAPNVAGRVTTHAGVPVPGVEVRIGSTSAITRTDDRGDFAFTDGPKGVQTLLFRRIGYLPTSVAVRIPEGSDTVRVMMVPAASALDTVKVSASLNVLAGLVIDSANRALPGAMVEMLGTKKANATTDATGSFTFTSVRSGTVVLRVRKLGYEPLFYSATLSDWRGVVLRLTPLAPGLSESKVETKSGFGNRSEWVWNETHDRLARRSPLATIVPREELAPFGNLSLLQAISQSRSGALAALDLLPPGNEVCVLLDGSRMVGSTNLDTWRADDVAFVELYPPGTETSGTVARYLRDAGCRNLRLTTRPGRGPYYAVVWLRA